MTVLAFLTVAASEGEQIPPWWGVPVIAGSFLVLGAVLGFIFNRLNDKRRERRETRTKWHGLVRELAAEVITHTDRVWELRQWASNAQSMPIGVAERREVLEADLHTATSLLRDKANELMLLSSKELALAVGLLVHETIHAEGNEDSGQVKKHGELRRAFTDAVRRYLEIDPS